ncbi:cytochrome P450 [Actinomadura graeca]|uniref:Cytochrome P450 n=1 Tax=Actinomadura graeca TaxID=2750812 RepID=A0ABX8QUL4_9ACTN|nr:cytochrome P450 [Actinomadura graeca]QXJ21904.1 cytochrome P450 [Actinomadura graeca]
MPQRRGALPISDAEVLGCPDTYVRGIPYDRLERLRGRTPVVWLDGRLAGRPGSWAVLRYEDVRHALAHPELFSPDADGVLHGPLPGDGSGADAPDGPSYGAPDGGPARIDMDPPTGAMLDRMPDGAAVDFVTDVVRDLPETLRDTLAGGVHALIRHPVQYERLRDRRADDGLLDSAVEEMLRWWTPVMQVWRTMRRGTVIGGVPLLAGERVALWLASANHDDGVFPEPARFLPDRFRALPAATRPSRFGRTRQREQRVRPHLCFGQGDRACLGARLARVHLRALLVALLNRPGCVRPAGEPVMLRSSARHGFERLPIRWTG